MSRASYCPPPGEFSIDIPKVVMSALVIDALPLDFVELTPRHNVNLIVVHSQQGFQSMADEHEECIRKRHWSGLGYHLWILPTGGVFPARPLWAVGAHAVGYNETSIGICLAGDARHRAWPDPQYESLCAMMSVIMHGNKNTTRWCYHRDVCATDCPGGFAPFSDDIVRDSGLEYAPREFPCQFRNPYVPPRQ